MGLAPESSSIFSFGEYVPDVDVMQEEERRQEGEYDFPYHYVPRFREGFTQSFTWTWGRQYLAAVEFILAEIAGDSPQIESIVDLGCGDGRLTRELTIEFPGKRVTGIDYSERAISLARGMNPGVDFICADITTGGPGDTYDAITLMEVFEHIPPDRCHAFVTALSKLLTDRGIVYLTVPHKNKAISYKHFQHFDEALLSAHFNQYFELDRIVHFDRKSRLNALFDAVMINRLYVLNNTTLNNALYRLYKRYLFSATAGNAGRIYARLIKR